ERGRAAGRPDTRLRPSPVPGSRDQRLSVVSKGNGADGTLSAERLAQFLAACNIPKLCLAARYRDHSLAIGAQCHTGQISRMSQRRTDRLGCLRVPNPNDPIRTGRDHKPAVQSEALGIFVTRQGKVFFEDVFTDDFPYPRASGTIPGCYGFAIRTERRRPHFVAMQKRVSDKLPAGNVEQTN